MNPTRKDTTMARSDRISALVTAVLAVGLWLVGLVVSQGTTSNLSDKATDRQVLDWIQGNKNPVIMGCWLFMIGCVAFIWFVGVLRARLAAAEGGTHTLTNIAFGGGIATAVLGIGTQSDAASAINASDITPATAGALHHVGDLFFMGAELSLIAMLAAVTVLAFRTAVVPRWWGIVGAVIAVVLLIGPIGWAALIFGLPIWTLGTAVLVFRGPKQARAAAPTPATA
jgi:hypothetical protein